MQKSKRIEKKGKWQVPEFWKKFNQKWQIAKKIVFNLFKKKKRRVGIPLQWKSDKGKLKQEDVNSLLSN